MPAFSLPRRQFPDGPFTQSELASKSIAEINAIPMTKENALQLAYYLDPITASDIRASLGTYYDIEAHHITTREHRVSLFRDWPSTSIQALKPVLENYRLAHKMGHAYAYIPQVYFFDEESSRLMRSGPFFVQPSRYTRIKTYYRSPANPCDIHIGTHPHVRDEQLCLGDESAAYQSTVRSHDNLTPLMIIEQVLQVYNPESPYYHFKAHWPARVEVPETPVHRVLLMEPGYTEPVIKLRGGPSPERTLRRFGGVSLLLTNEEFDSLKNATRATFEIIFARIVQYESATTSDWCRIADAILPAGDLFNSRLAAAGINLIPGFNSSDVLMNALYTPLDRRYCFDTSQLPDTLEDSDDTGQAEDGRPDEDADEDEYGGEEDDEEIDEDEEDDEGGPF